MKAGRLGIFVCFCDHPEKEGGGGGGGQQFDFSVRVDKPPSTIKLCHKQMHIPKFFSYT